MSTEENEKKEPRPRKVARSASTAAQPGFKPGDAASSPAEGASSEGASADAGPAAASSEGRPDGARSERKWDVRAERPAGGGPGGRPPRGPRPGGGPGGPRRPPFRGAEADSPRGRPGVSGGRATPELPQRGPVDRASADFVDRWINSKPRPPGERPPFGRDRGPRREGDDRRPPRRDGEGPPRGAAPGGKPALSARPVEKRREDPTPAKKLPTLHETILVGLPKVAVERSEKLANKPKTAREAIAAKAAAAPAKPQEKAAPKGELVVDPKWITADASNAVEALIEAGDAAEKLVDLWTQANNAAAIVEAASAEVAPSNGRKAAKRAINVLRARGVALPERSAKPAAPMSTSEEEVVEATFTAPDARGTVSFTISKRQGGNRAHISEVIVRDGVGVLQAVATWMSRSQIKEAHQRVADSSGIPPVPVPAEWVRWRIAEAKKDNAVSKALVPLGLDRCKELVEPVPATAPDHPIKPFEASIGEAPAELKKGLHEEPEFRGWLPDGASLDELIRNVGQALGPDDSKESAKVETALKEEMKAATDRYFTPEARTVLARRMRDAALSVKHRAGNERAVEVLHVIQAIEKAGLITSPPRDIEFLHAFFEKGVAFLASRAGGSLRVPVRQ